MFDTYEKIKWEAIIKARYEAVGIMMDLDQHLSEAMLADDCWGMAYKDIHELVRILNIIEKTILVVRCRKLEEKEFGKPTKTGK